MLSLYTSPTVSVYFLQRMTKALALATFVSTLGVMQIGYNLSLINHPLVVR